MSIFPALLSAKHHYPITQEKFDGWYQESKQHKHKNLIEFHHKFFEETDNFVNFLKRNPEICIKCIKRGCKITLASRPLVAYNYCMRHQIFEHLHSERVYIADATGSNGVYFNSTLFRLFAEKFDALLQEQKKDAKEESQEARHYEVELPVQLSHNALQGLKEIVYHRSVKTVKNQLSLTDLFSLMELIDKVGPESSKNHLFGLIKNKIPAVTHVNELIWFFNLWEEKKITKDIFLSVLVSYLENNAIRYLCKGLAISLPPDQMGLLSSEDENLKKVLIKCVTGICIKNEIDLIEVELLKDAYFDRVNKEGIEEIVYIFPGKPILNLRTILPSIKYVSYPLSFLLERDQQKVSLEKLYELAAQFENYETHLIIDSSSRIQSLVFTYTDLRVAKTKIHFPPSIHTIIIVPNNHATFALNEFQNLVINWREIPIAGFQRCDPAESRSLINNQKFIMGRSSPLFYAIG